MNRFMTLIGWLAKADKNAFIYLHRYADYPFLDNFFLVVRNALTWIPLYCFLLYFTITKNKKNVVPFILLSVICFALCDRISAGLLKPLFERPRPCYDPEIQRSLRHIIECGGLYSFPSSHATNHGGLASFWYWSILYSTGKKWTWLWLWALLVGYAQIYVGKHYPLDIAAGLLLGTVIGLCMAKIYQHWHGLINTFKKIFPAKPTRN